MDFFCDFLGTPGMIENRIDEYLKILGTREVMKNKLRAKYILWERRLLNFANR